MKQAYPRLSDAVCSTSSILFAALLILSALPTLAQEFDVPPIERSLNNGMTGTDFWFAIPPTKGSFGGSENLYVLVASTVDTKIELTVGGGSPVQKEVKANETAILSSDNNLANWAWEVKNSEQIESLGIHITADDPVAVSVLTAKQRAADAFAVIPTHLLGTYYINCSYYDNPGFGFNTDIGGGFLIVATQDGTSVNYTLDGVDISSGQTVGGLSVGESRSISLQAGEAYAVISAGEADAGQFDLTGSTITSTKPVAVIGFHQNSALPAAAFFASTGALCEMLPPVTAWGTEFASYQYNNSGQGSYYRIIASQPDTKYEAFSYKNGEIVSTKSGLLSNIGDMKEFDEADPRVTTGGFLQDMVYWKADKPVLVMQYSFGENFNSGQPYMSLVPPLAQGLKSSFFSVPAEVSGSKLNIFAEGDPDDEEALLLRSVRLNGKQLVTSNPSFIVNRVPGTNWYFTEIDVQPGRYTLDGDARHIAYLYGRVAPGGGGFTLGGYGMPVSAAVNHLESNDAEAPTFTTSIDCGVVTVLAKDNKSIAAVEFIDDRSVNAEFTRITPRTILNLYGVTQYSFSVGPQPGGHLSPVKALFAILDRAGNITIDSVEIPASTEIVEMSPSRVNFGPVRLQTERERSFDIENPTAEAIEILELDLVNQTVFTKIDWPETPFTIEAFGSQELKVMYKPTREDIDNTMPDRDSVIASTECFQYKLGLMVGRGVTANTAFENQAVWDAGTIEVGNDPVCYEGQEFGLRNYGTEIVTLTRFTLQGADWSEVPFDKGSLQIPDGGLALQPGDVFYVSGMCFDPTDAGEFEVQIVFETSADESISMTWRGEATKTVSVTDESMPGYRLDFARPNPADAKALIPFALGGNEHVRISLYDARGNLVAVVLDEVRPEGQHNIEVDTAVLPVGHYFYRLEAGSFNAGLPLQVVR